MRTPQDSPFMQARHGDLIAEARIGLRDLPAVASESYLGTYALVGALGGIATALFWLMLKAAFQL